jgi:hypothetical protein
MHVLEVTSYDIHHPEMVIVKRSTMDLYFSAAHPRAPLAERQVTVALLHITRLETIPAATSALSNGA